MIWLVSALLKYIGPMQRHVIRWYSYRVSGVVLFRMFNILLLYCYNMFYWALRMCDRRSWYRIPAHKLHFHQLSAPSCCLQQHNTHTHTHTHTHPFNVPFSETTRVSRYEKGKTNLDLAEARDSEWPWHKLSHMQVCTSLQTDNHTSTPPLSFLQTGCPSCRPTNSVKALKATTQHNVFQILSQSLIY